MMDLDKEYQFTIVRSYEGEKKFISDPVSAFELASNYEADLYHNGQLLLSPLGLSWEENVELIENHLGRQGWKETPMYGKSFNLGWKDFYDPEIKPITTSKYKVIAIDFDGNEISYLYEDNDGDPALDRIERHMRNHCQSYRVILIPEYLKVYSKQSPDFIDLQE